MFWPWRSSTDDSHIGSRLAEKAVQNVGFMIVGNRRPENRFSPLLDAGADWRSSRRYAACQPFPLPPGSRSASAPWLAQE